MDIREAWILLLPVLQMEIQFSRSANTVLWKTLGFSSPGAGSVSAFQLKSQLPEHQNFHSLHSISNHISYHCFSLLIAVDLTIRANFTDSLWYEKRAIRSCFIRWVQYLALFILVSGLFIPCTAIGGRYLQGWERWVTACSLQRLLRPYWNRRIGSAVGLSDPTSLGPQHCCATFFALVLYGRLQCCKRRQELAIHFQWHCKGI